MTSTADDTRAPKPLPTSARGRRTRQALLDAARRVFVSQGYADVTAATITTEAGVSYGSFYVYFSSKADIFTEIARQLIDDVYLATRAPLRETDPVARMEYENRRYFELYRENSALLQLVEEVARTDEDFRSVWKQFRRDNTGRVAKGLRRLQKDGTVDPSLDPDCAASVLGGMAERAAYLAAIDDRFDEEVLQGTLSALWSNALGLRTTL